ncbi:MAG: FAD-dependent monooxygenase [Bryobacteraceae bacterium]
MSRSDGVVGDTRATDVLIVGAGPVGLALAIDLGLRSVPCIVVEQHDRVGLKPRAKLTNVRSLELLRRWGIAESLRRASPLPPDYPSNIVFATRLNGYTLARFEDAFHCARTRSDLYSESGQWVPQYTLEEVLRQRAAGRPGVQLRFDCRLEKITQDGKAVFAEVEDVKTGARSTLRAGEGIRSIEKLKLSPAVKRKIYSGNALKLLRLPRQSL